MQPARAGGRTRGGGIPPVVAVKAYVAADVATAQATATQLENARLSYQAQLAGDYFELHGIDGDVDLFQRTVNSYKDYLDLTRTRFNAGVASDADVAQAETQLDTTQAQLIDLEVTRAQFEHAIAILTGKPPSGLSISKLILKTPPLPSLERSLRNCWSADRTSRRPNGRWRRQTRRSVLPPQHTIQTLL
jgi:outer membrane protein TolC